MPYYSIDRNSTTGKVNLCCGSGMSLVDGGWSVGFKSKKVFQSNGHFMYLDSGLAYTCVCICQKSLKAHLRLTLMFVNCMVRFLKI